MKSKRWTISVAGAFLLLLCLTAAAVLVVDPYFHYHKPLKGMAYEMEDVEYANDGIARNFDYDTVIIGTSTTWGFSIDKANELFDVDSIRLTFPGEGFKRTNEGLQAAINTHPDLKTVFRGVDTLLFITDEEHQGYDVYPEYLYDDDIWNDVYYLFNGDVLCNKVFLEVVRSLKQEEARDFDSYNGEYATGNREAVIEAYERPDKEEGTVKDDETEQMFQTLNKNLEYNVIDTIEANPDITFYIFFPPYSILWWDELNQHGRDVLERRIEMEKIAIEKLITYENVRLFSFNTNEELVCNLDHYTDDVHYTADINTQMLEWMKDGEYELTEDNYMEYLNRITEFYCNYDYDNLFQ